MGFDAPDSGKQIWPYLPMTAAWLILLIATFLVLDGVQAMTTGRTRRAYLTLTPPAPLAGAFVVAMRFV